jgi:hypothetical protein
MERTTLWTGTVEELRVKKTGQTNEIITVNVPVVFMALILRRAISITRAITRGEIETFLCPEMTTSSARAIWAQMALAYPLDAISQGPKTSRFPGPNPLPLAQVIDAARIKSITHRTI